MNLEDENKSIISNDETIDYPTDSLNPNNNIPKNIFIETDEPVNQIQQPPASQKRSIMNENITNENSYDLQYLYSFLLKDYETDGYNDAISNPDMSHMDNKVKLIRRRLDITIAQVTTYYDNLLRNINFHIESRSRNGMVDIVGELNSKKTSIEEELLKVHQIEKDAKLEAGLSEALIMSYTLGFTNGYAAISHSQLI
jgi:hypothetical protein